MTPIDDLKPGMFVALVEYKGRPVLDPHGNERQHNFDGQPLEVLSISLPFILVGCGDHIHTIDAREFEVQRLKPDYIRKTRIWSVKHRRKRRRERPDSHACPRCGERMIQRSSKAQGYVWRVVCPNCGFDNGPFVEAET